MRAKLLHSGIRCVNKDLSRTSHTDVEHVLNLRADRTTNAFSHVIHHSPIVILFSLEFAVKVLCIIGVVVVTRPEEYLRSYP